MTSEDLYAKARDLDALAADVETCVDVAWGVPRTPEWDCANANDVRGALDQWRSAARTSAGNLREEASRVRGEAGRAAQREQDARDAQNTVPR
ncbi:hypothetical protein [Cellulomonas xylanilytica]|uniref:Uncharacterized protein n=1 Tax=Cellulomonas xylanilytica TaxID=233583 RepID=A0A510UZU2_9CELL|nr:hypothetical protein [Cellulomonas xylanilytica]GEK20194.1 hypothetical protein CXY01_07140 [Cellulomonas xylanilytica]